MTMMKNPIIFMRKILNKKTKKKTKKRQTKN